MSAGTPSACCVAAPFVPFRMGRRRFDMIRIVRENPYSHGNVRVGRTKFFLEEGSLPFKVNPHVNVRVMCLQAHHAKMIQVRLARLAAALLFSG
jgi:hypothetical protein